MALFNPKGSELDEHECLNADPASLGLVKFDHIVGWRVFISFCEGEGDWGGQGGVGGEGLRLWAFFTTSSSANYSVCRRGQRYLHSLTCVMEMPLGCGCIQFHCCRSGPDTVPQEVMSCTECIYKNMLCLTLFTHPKMPINNNNCALVHLFLSPQYFKPSLLFIVCSGGNASPLAIRSTTYCVPRDGQMVLLSRLPLGALVTPLVKQNAGEVGLIKIWTNRNKVQPILFIYF